MDDAVTIARKTVDVFDHGDWEQFAGELHPDGVYREPATGREIRGIEGNVAAAKAWHDAFPDAVGEITNAFENAEGDQAVLQIVWHGTQTGPLVGPMGTIPPTGKKVTMPAVQVVRVKDGKILSTDHYFDIMGMLVQLGVVPAPEGAPA